MAHCSSHHFAEMGRATFTIDSGKWQLMPRKSRPVNPSLPALALLHLLYHFLIFCEYTITGSVCLYRLLSESSSLPLAGLPSCSLPHLSFADRIPWLISHQTARFRNHSTIRKYQGARPARRIIENAQRRAAQPSGITVNCSALKTERDSSEDQAHIFTQLQPNPRQPICCFEIPGPEGLRSLLRPPSNIL